MSPAKTSTVLVVDDTPDNLTLMNRLLKDDYRVKVASHGERALGIASSDPAPDLILLDVMMPGMDGYEVCRRLKSDPRTRDVPVIFLTAKSEIEDEQRGLELGAADYITKPISPPIVLTRIKTHLTLKAATDALRDRNATLEAEVARRMDELAEIQDVFGRVVDARIRDHLLKKRALMVGDVTEGAVMFCDIRGFTAYAEARDPRTVVEFLNRFFSAAAGCVEREGGFISKYLGDAFMAVFGTPFPIDDFRAAAIRAALRVREAVRALNLEHPEEEPFHVGMGVHAGPMVAGIVGSPHRMEFTIIGDTVNTASRMEALCKVHGVELIVSSALLAGSDLGRKARPLGPAAIRGRNQQVQLFAL